MSDISAKITITAIDHASAVVKNIGNSLDRLKAASRGVGVAWNNLSSAGANLGSKLAHISVVAVGAGAAIWGLTKHYAELSEQISLSASKSGVGVEALQRLQFSAKLANVDSTKLDLSLKMLNKTMAMSEVTGKGGKLNAQAKMFQNLGISVRDATGQMKTADKVMMEIADKYKTGKYSKAQETLISSTLMGGRSGTALNPMLEQGSAAIAAQGDEAARAGHILTPKEIEQNKKFEDSMKTLNTAVGGLGATIATALIPVITPVIDGMTEWIAANKDWLSADIKDAVIQFGHGLSIVWEVLKGIKAVIWPIVSAFGGLKTIVVAFAGGYFISLITSIINVGRAIYGLISAVWSLNLAFLANPIFLAIAGVIALGAAIYELTIHFDAVKSAAENFWNRLPEGAKIAVRSLAGILTAGLSEVAIAIYKNFDAIKEGITGGFTHAIEGVTSLLNGLKSIFLVGIQSLVPVFQWFAQIVIQSFSAINSLLGAMASGISAVKSALLGVKAPAINVQGGTPAIGEKTGAQEKTTQGTHASSATNRYSMLSTQNQKIDIHMKIDSDGKPKQVTAKTNPNTSFHANVGAMV